MDATHRFRYRPVCSAPGCEEAAVYKIGAPWSDGTRHELKNYGLACPGHRDAQMERARVNRNGLKLEVGESMGDVRLFLLDPARRASALESVAEHASARPPG